MNEIIAKKLTELSAQKEQLLAQLNAVIGAEQVLKELICLLRRYGGHADFTARPIYT